MSSPLTVKRRKLDGGSNSLTKPFVSPLKTAKSDPSTPKQKQDGTHAPYRPSMLAHTIAAAPNTLSKPSTIAKQRSFTTTKSTPIRKSATTFSAHKPKDPAEVATQKAITTLELQIRTLRNEIDTLTQAARLQTSNRDAELEDLASKWKSAAQSAAEEVFGTVKERVCRMGGVQAWREAEKRKFERSHGIGEFAEKKKEEEDDDEDCEFDSQGEELPEEEVEWRKSEKRRLKKERMEAMEGETEDVEEEEGGKKGMVWEEDGKDDDAFTMDMMLRSLNIELDVIGYEKESQRWVS